jgi:hypothetical protein
MKDSRKEFIKQGHKAACSEWKEKIEKEFPNLFKKDALVVGKWYKENFSQRMVCINKPRDFVNGYGFGCEGWVSYVGTNYGDFSGWTLATDKEVEEALIKEAKKRGFKEGVRYIGAFDGLKNKVCGFCYFFSQNQLCSNGGTIFITGKWAEILETITKEQAEKELGKTILN